MKARNTRDTTPVFIKTPNPFRSIGGGDMKSPSETADCCGKGKQSESEITSLQEFLGARYSNRIRDTTRASASVIVEESWSTGFRIACSIFRLNSSPLTDLAVRVKVPSS